MSLRVCVDASLGLKLVLWEHDSLQARALWQRWVEEDREIAAPPLFLYECASALRAQVHRKLLTEQEGDLAFRTLQEQRVSILSPPDLHPRAWSLAKQLQQSKVYDSYYLALADLLDCEFWTADERLAHAAKGKFPRVHQLGAEV